MNRDQNASAAGRGYKGDDGEKPCLNGRQLLWDQWKSLSKADKDLVTKRRQAMDKLKKRQVKAAKAAWKVKAAQKAAAAKAAKEASSNLEESAEDDEPTKDAGNQFGRRAHKSKKDK